MIKMVASIVFSSVLSNAAYAEIVRVSEGLDVFYQKSGHGKLSLVLVPGWAMSSQVFERQLKFFSNSEDFTIYAIDPRSQGRSSKTDEGNYYEQHGKDVNDFLNALKIENVVLAGWSNGGFDVLSYVDQYGSKSLAGIIMIDAAPKGSGKDNTKDWAWFNQDDSDGYRRYFTQKSLLHRDELNDEFAKWMVEDPTPSYMSWVTKISNQTSNHVAALLNESSAYQDYSKTLKGLEGTTKLLYFANYEKAEIVKRWAADNTPSARVEVFPKHLSFWERDKEFNKTLNDFLKSISTSL